MISLMVQDFSDRGMNHQRSKVPDVDSRAKVLIWHKYINYLAHVLLSFTGRILTSSILVQYFCTSVVLLGWGSPPPL